MLSIEEATEIDKIIGILRIAQVAELIYTVASLEQREIQPYYSLITKINTSILPQKGTFFTNWLVKNGLAEIKSGQDRSIIIKLTSLGKKFAAFVNVAHKSKFLRYILLMSISPQVGTPFTTIYVARTLSYIKIFKKSKGYSPQSAANIARGINVPVKAIFRCIHLLSEEEFVKLVKPDSPGPKTGAQKAVDITQDGSILLEEMEEAFRAYQGVKFKRCTH